MERHENGKVKLPYFSAIGCEASINAVKHLHEKAIELKADYSLHYNTTDGAWCITLDSLNEEVCYKGHPFVMHSAFEAVFDHLEKFCKLE